ncbi:MAG: RsmD family RNA methyltransferase [Chloroflexota bacterium]
MRVIAGSAKGRHLKGPPRRGAGSDARPSSDMMRGALFSALDAMGADFTRVLDLYAGTGALGIEALSRGAEWCDFVEKDRAMAEVIRENLRLTGFETRAKVYPVPSERALERLSEQYTLVLADPPYADANAAAVLAGIASSALVGDDTTVVYEHSARGGPVAEPGRMQLVKSLRHGDSSISIYCLTGGQPC